MHTCHLHPLICPSTHISQGLINLSYIRDGTLSLAHPESPSLVRGPLVCAQSRAEPTPVCKYTEALRELILLKVQGHCCNSVQGYSASRAKTIEVGGRRWGENSRVGLGLGGGIVTGTDRTPSAQMQSSYKAPAQPAILRDLCVYMSHVICGAAARGSRAGSCHLLGCYCWEGLLFEDDRLVHSSWCPCPSSTTDRSMKSFFCAKQPDRSLSRSE